LRLHLPSHHRAMDSPHFRLLVLPQRQLKLPQVHLRVPAIQGQPTAAAKTIPSTIIIQDYKSSHIAALNTLREINVRHGVWSLQRGVQRWRRHHMRSWQPFRCTHHGALLPESVSLMTHPSKCGMAGQTLSDLYGCGWRCGVWWCGWWYATQRVVVVAAAMAVGGILF
jgi:hypothetical protein